MKKLLAIILALSMLFCFAACGGRDSDDKSDKSDDEDKYIKFEEDDEDTENDDDDDSKKTIVVGYTIFEPMNYKDANGDFVGFDTELAKAVFEKLGYKVVFKEIEWDQKFVNLNSGNIDCIWNGLTPEAVDEDGTPRTEKADFSYNYMDNTQVVVVRSDSGIATYDDLNGKVAVAEYASVGESYATYVYEANCTAVNDKASCLIEVRCGAADFAVVDYEFAKKTVGFGDYSDLKVVSSLTSAPEHYAVAFKKGSSLTAKVNKQLEALAADGTIAALAKKYGLEYAVITDFADQK